MTYSVDHIRSRLLELRDEEYARFSAQLLPGVEPPLGVRLPMLRKLAKEIAKSSDRSAFLAAPVGTLFEERMLYGMVLGYAALPLEESFVYCRKFVPSIDNWSVCDSAVSTFVFAKKEPQKTLEFLQPYLQSEHEFEARFGLVMLLWHFKDTAYLSACLDAVRNLNADGYYAKMAAAWLLCECFTRFSAKTVPLFESEELDLFVHNKAIQKICESRRVSPDDKAALRALRRSE